MKQLQPQSAIRSYFPQCEDSASFLSLINTWWTISNSKSRFHPNYLGNGIIKGDHKIDFFYAMADWLEKWSKCPNFVFTKQTMDAMITTLRCSAMLVNDLLNEGYSYVLSARLQSDPLERYYGRIRQMSGGRFLVSLAEMNSSQRIILLRSLIMEDINFWDEDVFEDSCVNQLGDLEKDVEPLSTQILEICLNPESLEVSVMVAGYIAKKLIEKLKCDECKHILISKEDDVELEDTYLKLVSRGGLTVPSKELSDFVSHAFAALDFFDKYISNYPSLGVRQAATHLLTKYIGEDNFSCDKHNIDIGKRVFKSITNVYYNNKRKISTDNVRKDDVKVFKKRQRTKDESCPPTR